ncbi:hypothetical protein [Sulfurimonas sp.]|uniref:hypothetical protein n=1 Tax=Sulfurimonas sp. TaxID=2022749 RepID=UPI00260B3AC4|nr:hypothetical protein [Sulfurimonas sp.]MCW8895584.1 hypothetical protein [Sulfurimonas sp.]
MKIKIVTIAILSSILSWSAIKFVTTSDEPGISRTKVLSNIDTLKSSVSTKENVEYIFKDENLSNEIDIGKIETSFGAESVDSVESNNNIKKLDVAINNTEASPILKALASLPNDAPPNTSNAVILASSQTPLYADSPPVGRDILPATYSAGDNNQENSKDSVLDSIVQGVSSVANFVSSGMGIKSRYPDKGFYGSLNFLYVQDDYTNSTRKNSKENFTQEYKLGYKGNIYSPRLLEYTLEGLFRFDTEELKTNEDTSKQKTTGKDYKVYLNFIKETKTPFTIYANKTQRPVNTVYSAYSTNYEYETSGEGITGSLNFEPFMVTYGATTTKTVAEFSDRMQDSQTTTYNSSFRYSEKKHNVQANYSHSVLENEQNYLNGEIISVNQVKDRFAISHDWKAIEDLSVVSTASYENDDFYLRETIDAGVNLSYRPKDADYNTYLSFLATTMEYGDSTGDEKSVFDSLNINQGFTYKLTPSITLTESAMAYIYDTTTSKGSNTYINLDARHNYETTIFSDVPFTLVSSVGVQRNDSVIKTILDANSTTTKTSTDRYNLNLTARGRKSFPSINSNLNVDGSYYHYLYSTKREEQRYNFGFYFISKIFNIVNNNITARYSQTDILSEPTLSMPAERSSNSKTSITDTIDFHYRLGVRGRIGFKIGAEYINTKTDSATDSNVNPRAEMNMNYRFFSRWMFDASARVSEAYNTLEHSGSANLTFRAGKTSFLMGYQYNKSEIESVLNTIRNDRSIFKIQLTRTF